MKRLGVDEITPIANEKMELQVCWVVVDHGVEAEVARIHNKEEVCNDYEEKTMLKMLKNLVFCSFCTLLSCSLMPEIHFYL